MHKKLKRRSFRFQCLSEMEQIVDMVVMCFFMHLYIRKSLFLPVISKCCRLLHRVTKSNSAWFVIDELLCICKWVSPGHLRVSNWSPLSDTLLPSLSITRSTVGHNPFLVCPHNRRKIVRIALSPHLFSPVNCAHKREIKSFYFI